MFRQLKIRNLNGIIRRHLASKKEPKVNSEVNTMGAEAVVAKGHSLVLPINVLPQSKYGGITTVSLLTGESLIGKQGGRYVSTLLQNARVPVEVQRIRVDQENEYLNSVVRNRAAVHIEIVHDAVAKKKALKICHDLDLYVFMSRLRTFPGFNCRFADVDIQLIAQNNMGNYAELEYVPVRGVVEALSVVIQENLERYLKYAFQAAVDLGRKRVTVIHKISEWPVTDGVLVDVAKHIHEKDYSCLELETMELDDTVSRLILDPNHFDVLMTSDRYATFVATICSGVCGGANLFSAIEKSDNHAVFKPLQTKLSLTNYKTLSPYGIVSTCVDLLNHVNQKSCATNLWNEMLRTMREGIKTGEFGGSDSGNFVICNIMNQLRCNMFSEVKP
ncbi:uncharacterized protein Dwil_GK19318 [Drosophila willistoni]|uniref:Isopropylmalate dehydrogenase-like domain-containing protein n=1 Tax=Drosophila willistoni TaxID=7260 RepID=B4MJY3_DROWI|nr:isocitrate dehydrogenase [NAD] subunit gamma, mitochondrial [Drosophila willistoni]EDW72422.1 uncharacterized protein Dwil_GK19318 [Drosophila willistoni]